MRRQASATRAAATMSARGRRRSLFSGTPARPWPDAAVHHGVRWTLLLALAGGLVLLYPPDPGVFIGRHELGTVADRDIIAASGFDVPKAADELRRERAEAAAAVIPTFNFDASARAAALEALAAFFARVDSAAAASGVVGVAGVLSAAGIDATPEQTEALADAGRARAVYGSATGAVERLVERGVMAPGAASEVTTDSIRVSRGGAETLTPRSSVLSGREFYEAALAGREGGPETEGPETELLPLILARYMVPSLVPDAARIGRDRAQARDSVAVTAARVLQGEAIVRANDPVGPAELHKLDAYRSHLRASGTSVDESNLSAAFGGFVLNAILLSIFGFLIFFFRPDIYAEFRDLLALAAIAAIYFGGAFFVAGAAAFPGAALPTVFVTVVLAIMWDGRLALLTVLVLSALTAAQEPFATADTFLVALAGGGAAALAVRGYRRPSQIWRFIAITFGAYALALAAVYLRGAEFELPTTALWALSGTVIWAILGIGFLPVFEWLTGIATDQTLAGLADPNRPLIKRLAAVAPGTYAHTVQVANLAESGADDIGANAILCRAGAYYHDVGKMVSPEFFIENQRGDNPHDELDPEASAAIVRGHVVEGVKMARKEKVPAVLIDFISEHHGDQTIGFFFQRAADAAEREGREPPDPAKFRYPGPRPRTRETAILMLADSVESAARALKEPTPDRISLLIEEIFATKLERGQLDRAGLTLRDLTLLKRRFGRILGGIHHRRMDYPGTRHLTAGSAP